MIAILHNHTYKVWHGKLFLFMLQNLKAPVRLWVSSAQTN